MRTKRLAFLALFLLLAASLPAAAQSKTLHWERWDVDITVHEDGTFRVVETHEVAFTSGQFRFGLLTLDMSRLESISGVSISEGGVPYQEAGKREAPGSYETWIEDSTYHIQYYMLNPPVQNETRTIRIAYTVAGAIRYYEGGDQLYWEAVGALGWPIHNATVTVTLPTGAAPRANEDPVVCYGLPCTVDVNRSAITYQLSQVSQGKTPLEIRVQFPHGVLSGSAPPWQAAYDRERAYDEGVRPLLNLLVGALGLALLIGGPVGVFLLWRTRGRDPEIGPVPEYLSKPPSDLPAAVVGTLIDEQADMQDIMATLIDLARRGYLVMEEDREDGIFRSKTTFDFTRTDKPAEDLRPYEKMMLDRIFRGRDRRSLASLQEKFYTTIPRLQQKLYSEVVREGFFTSEPDNVRNLWRGFGMALVVLAALGMFLLPPVFSLVEAAAIIPVGLIFTGIAMSLAGGVMPAKTRKGAEQAALWNAFKTYLSRIEEFAQAEGGMEAVTDQFDRYLPYAVAFGLEKRWIKTFSRVPSTPVPYWYYPYGWHRPHHHHHGGRPDLSAGEAGRGVPDLATPEGGLQSMSDGMAGGLSSMSMGLATMLNSASSTFTSRPQNTSTGSWSSGGGSFSGGGFSGGGSSGGHGGGFG